MSWPWWIVEWLTHQRLAWPFRGQAQEPEKRQQGVVIINADNN